MKASDVLKGRFDPKAIAGKDIVLGTTAEGIDQYFIPGWGKKGGAYVQIIGAETLKAGGSSYFGWLPALALALLACWAAVRQKTSGQAGLILAGSAFVLLIAPIALEAIRLFVDITPALFAVAIVSTAAAIQRWKQRGLVNTVSGLPNLSALRANKDGREKALIAARVLNFAEIASALPPEQERLLVEQIVSRLRVGAPDRTLYEGDGGIFAWFEDPHLPVSNHVEALYTLFRNPARVDGQSIDLAISFGVEIGSGRSLTNRLASALVAADEAAHDGLKWKYYDPETLEDASWKLSILSQLDSAVDKGEVWVAYQPKYDLKQRRISAPKRSPAGPIPRRPDRCVRVHRRCRAARPHRQAHRLRHGKGHRRGRWRQPQAARLQRRGQPFGPLAQSTGPRASPGGHARPAWTAAAPALRWS